MSVGYGDLALELERVSDGLYSVDINQTIEKGTTHELYATVQNTDKYDEAKLKKSTYIDNERNLAKIDHLIQQIIPLYLLLIKRWQLKIQTLNIM
ncbi:MAG: hypothetical protein SOW90_01320 [Gallibacter sp.]|nr:hypothetical protein [Gallibacter sp.]